MACLQELGVPDYLYYLKLKVCLGALAFLNLNPDCDSSACSMLPVFASMMYASMVFAL